jgi:hypothetical protein
MELIPELIPVNERGIMPELVPVLKNNLKMKNKHGQ